MKRTKISALVLAMACTAVAVGQQSVYVDDAGTMRWNDTKREARFFGTNYTVPFAYAYRALGRKGVDRKATIEGDVYHMARLGLNAMRLHIWDVEISDAEGNLIDNEHLDLLDYLVAECEERGLGVVLTLQTNFGNGYPERNEPTEGFTYDYDKCDVHSNPAAQDAQQRYATQLMQHTNRYTGRTYGTDEQIVGYEINNEPCHRGRADDTQKYIDMMYDTMREAGCTRPIFYNASLNADHRQAIYASQVEGATYQWYPSGLVAGHARKGNFLPAIDAYKMPFDTLPGFERKAKVIYEFDPADLTTSYQYPAAARAFRKAGFQWMTQFAYDPTPLAAYNTEYQTHYMNLAYTPQKALSLAIAALVAREDDTEKTQASYPTDTIFGHTTVSYIRDLSVYNNEEQFIYTGSNDAEPIAPKKLTQVAGVGSSSVVRYEGTGAYFLDRLEKGVWRLEVMPDAVSIADAYEKPSESRIVTAIEWNENAMSIALPDLGDDVTIARLGDEARDARASQLRVTPGVYIVKAKGAKTKTAWTAESTFDGNKRVGEFVAPEATAIGPTVRHDAPKMGMRGGTISIECTAVGGVDSVKVYPRWISFWREENESVTLTRGTRNRYVGEIPAAWTGGSSIEYYVVAYAGDEVRTYPSGESGMPLDWDSRIGATYSVPLVGEGQPIPLMSDASHDEGVEIYSLPFYCGAWTEELKRMPWHADALRCHMRPEGKRLRYFVRKYVGDIVSQVAKQVAQKKTLTVFTAGTEGLDSLWVTLISKHGLSYSARVSVGGSTEQISVALSSLEQSPTALVPIGYPDYLPSYFSTTERLAFRPEDIEFVELSSTEITTNAHIDLLGIVIE